MNIFVNNSVLYIDLSQLRRNVRAILDQLGPGRQLIPVLKGNAYGLGLERVGLELAALPEVHALAVAQISEGEALRRAGVHKDVLVLGGIPSHLLFLGAELDLTLPVWRLGLLPRLARLGRDLGRPVKIQIKIETGLHRVGLLPGAELAALLDEWRAHAPWLRVTGAFTHFADLDDAPRSARQFRDFALGADQLEAGGMALPLRHISASAATEYFPEYGLGGARVGRRLYMDHPTRPLGTIGEVCSWRTWITQLRQLRAGDPVGYGGQARMDRDGVAAVIPVGYGDGLDRALVRAGAPVLVGGRRARMLACCMDQTILDVTGIPCQIDDEVTLLGRDRDGNLLSAQALSLLIGGDEGCGLTAQLTPRVGRAYI